MWLARATFVHGTSLYSLSLKKQVLLAMVLNHLLYYSLELIGKFIAYNVLFLKWRFCQFFENSIKCHFDHIHPLHNSSLIHSQSVPIQPCVLSCSFCLLVWNLPWSLECLSLYFSPLLLPYALVISSCSLWAPVTHPYPLLFCLALGPTDFNQNSVWSWV